MVHLGESISCNPPQHTDSQPCTRPPAWTARGNMGDTSARLFVALFCTITAGVKYRNVIVKGLLLYWLPMRLNISLNMQIIKMKTLRFSGSEHFNLL